MQGGSSGGPGYETRDANLRLAIWIGIGVLALIVAALVSMGGLLELLMGIGAERQPEPASLMRPAGGSVPPEPRLEEDPIGSLRALRQEEELLLTTYGWTDDRSDTVRIPVEHAMELLLERGVAARPSEEREGER